MESKNNNSKIDKTAREQTSELASSRARFTLISHMILFINDEVTIIIEHESSAQNWMKRSIVQGKREWAREIGEDVVAANHG